MSGSAVAVNAGLPMTFDVAWTKSLVPSRAATLTHNSMPALFA
jgi:hypothetical protein